MATQSLIPLSARLRLALRRHCAVFLVFLAAFASPSWGEAPRLADAMGAGSCKTNWLFEGKLGLSTHYFPHTPERREAEASAFQVERVAAQAADAGASWFLLTLHHQPWIMMAPNATLDRIMGNSNYTTQRDVPLELYRQLQPRNIKLMLYVNLGLDTRSATPGEVREALGGWPPNDRLIENIAAVYREFSLRYGDKVSGWWVDAAGRAEYSKSPDRERWFKKIADALRAGNPSAVVAFNPGLTVKRYSGNSDFTAGEIDNIGSVPSGRWLERAQSHLWTYVGGSWGSGGTRYSDEELGRFVSDVTERGGALTLEVGTRGVNMDRKQVKGDPATRTRTPHFGYIDPTQVEQIKAVIKNRRPGPAGQLTNCVN